MSDTWKPDFTKSNPYEGMPPDYAQKIYGTQAYDTAVSKGWIQPIQPPSEQAQTKSSSTESQSSTWKPDFTKPNPYQDAPPEYIQKIVGTQAYDTAVRNGWIQPVSQPSQTTTPVTKTTTVKDNVVYIGGVAVTLPKDSTPESKQRAADLIDKLQGNLTESEKNEITKKFQESGKKLEIKTITDEDGKKKEVVVLPDNKYIEKSQLDKVQRVSKEVYIALITSGFDKADDIIENQKTVYSNYQLANERLKKYTDEDGAIYGWRYLQDNPNDTTTLKQAGFSDASIKEWEEYNKNPWVRVSQQEKFMEAFIDAGGDPINGNTPEEMDRILKDNPNLLKMQYQDENLKQKRKVDISLTQFTANYIAVRENDKRWQKEGSREVLKDMAREEYNRVYGKGTALASRATDVGSILFAPARALHPEVEVDDISALEWVVGGAQIALLAAPMIAAPFSAGFGTGAGTAVRTTLNVAGAGTFATVTGLQWGEMTTPEKALAVGLNLFIIGSVMKGAGVKINKSSFDGMVNKIKSVDYKGKFNSAIDTLAKGMESNKTAMIRRGAHELEIVAGELELSPAEAKIIRDGGSYIKNNAKKYSDLINGTREYNAAESAKMKTNARNNFNNKPAEILNNNIKMWERLDEVATQQHINDKLKRLYDWIKSTKTKPVDYDTAVSESKFKIKINELKSKFAKEIERNNDLLQRQIDDIADEYISALKNKGKPGNLSEIKFKMKLDELKKKLQSILERNKDPLQQTIDDIADEYTKIEKPTGEQVADAKYKAKLSELKKKFKQQLERDRDIMQREIDDIYDDYQKANKIEKPTDVEVSETKLNNRLKELKEKYNNKSNLERQLDDIYDDYVKGKRTEKPSDTEISEAKLQMKLKELKEKIVKEKVSSDKDSLKNLFDDIDDYIKSGGKSDKADDLIDDLKDIIDDIEKPKSDNVGLATKEKVKTETKTKTKVKEETKAKESKPEVKTETKQKGKTYTKTNTYTQPYTDTELRTLTEAAMEYVVKPGQLIDTKTGTKTKGYPIPVPTEIPEIVTEGEKVKIIKPKQVTKPTEKPGEKEKPTPTPEPEPEKKPEPEPEKTKTPIPEPPEEPEPTPAPKEEPIRPTPGRVITGTAILRSSKKQKQARKLIKNSDGAIAWRQGKVGKRDRWDVVVKPYTSNEQYYMVLGNAPEGATILQRGKGSAYGTTQVVRGTAPKKPVKVDSGFTDITITPVGKRSVKMRVTADPKMETTGDITIGRGKFRRITPKTPKLR